MSSSSPYPACDLYVLPPPWAIDHWEQKEKKKKEKKKRQDNRNTETIWFKEVNAVEVQY